MRRPLPFLLVLLLAIAAAPARAATIGSDLAPAADSTYTCSNGFAYAPGATSCLAYGVIPSSYAPASGVVNTVRVKTGDFPQGPMQVVVLRSYYQNNPSNPGTPNYFCCFLQEYGPVFTPARNAVTTVPATLAMVEDATPPASDPNTVAKGDFLALSVLTGDVPIPMAQNSGGFTGFYAPAPQAPDNPPAPSPNGLPGGQGAAQGPTLLMNADIDTSGPATGGGGAQGGGGAGQNPGGGGQTTGAVPSPVAIRPTGGQLLGGAATVPLICRLTTACAGTLTLGPATGGRRAVSAAKKKAVVYGTAHFSIASGARRAIRVKLNAKGRKAARHHAKLVLKAHTVVSGLATTVKVTVRRP